MALRTYAFSFTGHITVDDTTLMTALLGFEIEPAPGIPELTEEEMLEVGQEFLAFTESLDPARRMQAYLVNGPLLRFDERLVRRLTDELPGSRTVVDGVTVTEEPLEA